LHDKELKKPGYTKWGSDKDEDNEEVYLCKTLAEQVHSSTYLATNQINVIKKKILPLVADITAEMLDDICGVKDDYFELNVTQVVWPIVLSI
jgi:hypothetical protein